MDDMITIPREILSKARDALEAIEDCFDFNTETWILYHQISVLLDPASAGFTVDCPANMSPAVTE